MGIDISHIIQSLDEHKGDGLVLGYVGFGRVFPEAFLSVGCCAPC